MQTFQAYGYVKKYCIRHKNQLTNYLSNSQSPSLLR